jgi:hypothetical protein
MGRTFARTFERLRIRTSMQGLLKNVNHINMTNWRKYDVKHLFTLPKQQNIYLCTSQDNMTKSRQSLG